ncbi:hypothetical protein SAMN06265795_12536 [Noviherbaspirillum humi]|uniref:Uncharacterized protein n=1 Tax=Noviherbaspirillum humi TaxID=1688639 RepID=A0A239LQB2_9BURK|nr:hypothetical protein [Noviherbaspirillum humi]SNT32651.1 hypothetical protein SAMN06265795_12536 [Noviherbaspirillum humi]
MQLGKTVTARSLVTGTLAGMATALATAMNGKREAGSYAAPLNATSHILWGDEAARHDDVSMKYTASGFLLNHAAAIMWAAIYEKWFAGRRGGVLKGGSAMTPALGAALVSAGAYVTDYHLVPKRFTPGYEYHLSGKSMALIYGALALGLVASTLLTDRD